MKRRLVKRIQRKAMGGMVYARVYDDGTVRIRTDHPSNDPAVEIGMTAVVIAAFRDTAAANGISWRVSGPLHWRDDA